MRTVTWIVAAAQLLVLGAYADTAAAQAALQIHFGTTENAGEYAPKNVVAVWVEDNSGGFVKTIGQWGLESVDSLLAWSAASGQDTDAISGATRANHEERLIATWDFTNQDLEFVEDGTYTLRMELADGRPTNEGDNRQGAFAFSLDHQSRLQSQPVEGFDDVIINYLACTNGDGSDCSGSLPPFGLPGEDPFGEGGSPFGEGPGGSDEEDTRYGPTLVSGGCQATSGYTSWFGILLLLFTFMRLQQRRSR